MTAVSDTGQPRAYLSWVLAANAGFVDAAGYVALVRLFTAHQSGNTAGLGVALGAGDWTDAWRRGVSILAFVVGVGVGTALVEINNRRRPRRSAAALAAVQMLVLGLALAVGEDVSVHGRLDPAQTGAYVAAAAALAGAMGLQTVGLRRIGGRSVRTTFVTGLLTNAAENFVVGLGTRREGGRRRLLSASALLGSVWVFYLAGGVAGGVAQAAWSFAALGVPLAVTAGVAALDLKAPYLPDLPAPGRQR